MEQAHVFLQFQWSCYQNFLWTLCGQKNSIQDGYMLTGDFAKYLCFGEFMQSEGEGVKSGAKVTDQAAV